MFGLLQFVLKVCDFLHKRLDFVLEELDFPLEVEDLIVFSFALASGFFWLWLWVVGLWLRNVRWLRLWIVGLWLRDMISWDMWYMVIDHWSGLLSVHVSTEGFEVNGIESCECIVTMTMMRGNMV